MRQGLLILIVLFGSAWALAHPYVGALMWTWISIMNPQLYTWGRPLPFAAVIGGATLIGLFLTKDRKNFSLSPPSTALILFVLWICITYPFSFYPDGSTDMLIKVLKIDLMVFVTMFLLYSRKHIMQFVWVLVFSLGFFGVKGGYFTLMTGGSYRVWGPEGSFIGGNNEIALAMIMVIPLMYFLRDQAKKIWQRQAWLAAMALTATASVGSQSRGAFVALGAMTLLLWRRGRQKLMFGTLLVIGGMLLMAFMPDSWHQRMDTIDNYQQDASAQGRINAWMMTWNIATHNLFGGGFDIYEPSLFAAYAPNPRDLHVAHSIYFSVLGEHGFVGLALFLSIWGLTWRSANWVRKHAKTNPETEWAAMLAGMCQVSLIGYAVGGAFLSLAYFDLPYDIMVVVVVTRRWLEQFLAGKDPDAPPEPKRKGAKRKKRFSRDVSVPPNRISEIVNGKRAITADTACAWANISAFPRKYGLTCKATTISASHSAPSGRRSSR